MGEAVDADAPLDLDLAAAPGAPAASADGEAERSPIAGHEPPAAGRPCPVHEGNAGAKARSRIGLRFYLYNMANNAELRGVETLRGLGGETFSSLFTGPLVDGSTADVVSATLPEAPLDGGAFEAWCAEHARSSGYTSAAPSSGGVSALVAGSAKSELSSSRDAGSRVRSLIEDFAADFNGDLRTVLGFDGERFSQDHSGSLFALLTDITVAGIAVPNPKKAFLGRTLAERDGLRLSFVGAHFPISGLAAMLESEEQASEILQAAKRSLAGTLRSILRQAGRSQLFDTDTVLFLQGDLNSRTVLSGSEARDVLLEVMEDELLQHAIRHNLPGVPPGRWYEVARHEDARGLPVTYKFQKAPTPWQQGSLAAGGAPSLRLGDVLTLAASGAAASRLFPSAPQMSFSGAHCPEAYGRALLDAGADLQERFGLVFKKSGFKPFRFPAAADRVIYWAPDDLAARVSWSLPGGGYHVDHAQAGSDHKPVFLEAVLHVAPASPEARTLAREDQTSDCAELSQLLDESAGREDGPAGAAPGQATGFAAGVSSAAHALGSAYGALAQRRAAPWASKQGDWHWTPDREAKSCEICGADFTLFRRRHHCRRCGACVCAGCSPPESKQPIPEQGREEPCRMCTKCAPPRVR